MWSKWKSLLTDSPSNIRASLFAGYRAGLKKVSLSECVIASAAATDCSNDRGFLCVANSWSRMHKRISNGLAQAQSSPTLCQTNAASTFPSRGTACNTNLERRNAGFVLPGVVSCNRSAPNYSVCSSHIPRKHRCNVVGAAVAPLTGAAD